ncbi:hypothetical protein F5Y16DRAFT_410068 [Xylariaceae sp. FL0255]|nr:hypothetical protein F5Y16DRAFT_410068 [Xylariaceae sp. FL0255]
MPLDSRCRYRFGGDRVIVVTGGASGIGACVVVFVDIQVDVVLKVAHRPDFHLCDLTDVDGALKPTAQNILAEHPMVHGLINNAAADARIPTLEITTEQWDAGLAVNLRHVFFMTQALMPALIKAEGTGSVISMGSITWAIPGTALMPYLASKAAIHGMTRSLAQEFGPQGVRVNSIMPGAIATERQKRDILIPEYEANVLSNQAIRRMLEPGDVARLALWLIADDGGAVTNQSIVCDAGWM